jgi:hypothetical protein
LLWETCCLCSKLVLHKETEVTGQPDFKMWISYLNDMLYFVFFNHDPCGKPDKRRHVLKPAMSPLTHVLTTLWPVVMTYYYRRGAAISTAQQFNNNVHQKCLWLCLWLSPSVLIRCKYNPIFGFKGNFKLFLIGLRAFLCAWLDIEIEGGHIGMLFEQH